LAIKGLGVPTPVLGALLLFVGSAATAFVWGYAKIMALADAATKLEGVAGKGILEREQYRLINNSLSEQTDIYNDRLQTLGKEVGLISHEANQLEAIIAPLEAMQERLGELNKEQVRLGDGEDAFADEQRQANADRELELVKDEFKMAFKFISASTNGVIGSQDQIAQVRDELAKIGVPWNQDCVDVVSDGWVHKYEVVNLIDKALHTRIYRMRFADDERAAAAAALARREEELRTLTAQAKKARGGAEDPEERKRKKKEAAAATSAAGGKPGQGKHDGALGGTAQGHVLTPAPAAPKAGGAAATSLKTPLLGAGSDSARY
jgi:hypothetical protein